MHIFSSDARNALLSNVLLESGYFSPVTSNVMHYFFQTSRQIKVSYPSHHALQFMSFSIVK